MDKNKKIWFIEQYAQKAWTVSLALAQEAARAGQYGRGYAVVAHEARVLADKMYAYVAEARFGNDDDNMFRGIIDLATMFKFASVNAALEILHMADISMDFNIPKSMSVFAEELRRLAISLNELTDDNLRKRPLTIPELASPSEAAGADNFFLYSICGHTLIENPKKILEIHLYPRKSLTEKMTYSIRGEEIPILDCCRLLKLPYTKADEQAIMIIDLNNKEMIGPNHIYAVPIDDMDVNSIFYSKLGRSVLPKKEHAFADYSRECWDAAGGDQLIFVDWKKIIEYSGS